MDGVGSLTRKKIGFARKTNEFQIQRLIWEFLNVNKVFCHIDFQPPGKDKWYQHHSSVGVADILGIFRGKPLAIEVKMKGNKPTEKQKEYLARFKKEGGIAFVAYSLEDVQKELGL